MMRLVLNDIWLALSHKLRAAWRVAVLLAGLFMCFCLNSTAGAAFTITPTDSTTFYTDAGHSIQCSYQSFNVTSSTAVTDAWIGIGSFSSYLSLGGGDPGVFHLGSFTSGQTVAAFFYVCSSYVGTTQSGQGYTLTVYDRNPSLSGATTLGSSTLSFTIDDTTIQASPNVVTVIFSGPNPGTLGGVITMTVQGATGSMGCVSPCTSGGGPLIFTPASTTGWLAGAYQLIGDNITLSGSGNDGSWNNTLILADLPNSATTNYTATYYFRAVQTTSTTTTLSPIGFIASGQQLKHTNINNGAYSTSGGLLPIDPASNTVVLSKTVSATTLPAQGGTVTYMVTLTNSGSSAVSLDDIDDTFPAGATYVAGSSSYAGTSIADPIVSGTTRIWSRPFIIPANSSASLIYQVTLPATPGSYSNSVIGHIGSTIIDTTLSTNDNVPARVTTTVLSAPTISKAFAPSALVVNGTSQLTLTLSNPNASQTLSGVAISDSYPSGLVNAANSGVATTCSGATPTTTANSVAISGVTLAAGASCTVTINVTSTATGSYANTTGTVTSSNGGNGTTASATVTFTTLPTISKAFTDVSIPVGGSEVLSFTITNNASVGISSMSFTDLFPSGMVLASTPGLTPASPCGGTLQSWNGTTASALAGGVAGVTLSGGALATPGGSCTFSVNVTSAAAGTYNNTTSGVNSSLASVGPVSNTATLVVMAPPQAAKAFSPSTIGKGQTSQLTITLTNTNPLAITGAAFTDTYPASLVNGTTPGGSTTCSGGSVTATASGGSVALSGATIPANGSCTVTVTVTSNTVNNSGYVNTLAAGAVTSTNAGSSTGTSSGTLIVNATPTITKSFTVNTSTGVNTLTLTITNNHTAGISGLSFSDTFPSGMSVDATPALSNTCGGTVTGGTSGSTALSLSGGAIASASPASCTISVSVDLASGGVYNNQTTGVTLTSPFTGTGSASNVATLIAPIVTKSFNSNTVGPNGVSVLRIEFTNPSPTTTLTSLGISDSYPAGYTNTTTKIVNTATPALSNSCGGTATAAAAASTLTLTGGSLGPGQTCAVTVNVSANPASPDQFYNQTGKVQSAQGIGSVGADTLYVVNMPTITKSFLTSPVTLASGSATTVLQIVLKSNATVGLGGISYTDIFPTTPSQMKYVGLVSNTCGGTLADQTGVSLVANSSTGLKVSGVTLGPGNSCTLQLTVSVSAAGTYNNQTSGATSTTSGFTTPGPTSNVATLVANLGAPTASKSFAAAQVGVNAPVTMTITLNNSNSSAITSAGFTDTYPGTMVNAASPALTNTCGGSATASPGGNTLVLAAGTIPASGSCTITVAVTATSPGVLTNSTGAITTGNAGSASAVSGSVTFYAPPTLSKSFSASTYGVGTTGTMNLVLTNPTGNAGALSNVQVADNLALTGLAVGSATVTFTPAACGTVTQNPSGALAVGNTNILFTASSLAVGASCQAAITVSNSTTGSLTNTTGTPSGVTPGSVTVTGSVASAAFTVVQPTLTKAWSGTSIYGGASTNLVFTLSNGASSPAEAGAAFTDSLPSSLKFNNATPTVTYGAGCSGSSVVTQGTPDTIAFSSIAMSSGTSSCTVTINGVTNRSSQYNASCSANPAAFTNGSSNISATTRLSNGVSNQCLIVNGLPVLTTTKTVVVFSDPINNTSFPKSIPGAVEAYTLLITNSGSGPVDNNTLVITDPVPANTSLYVKDIGATGSGPIAFSDGVVSSGLSWSFVSLSSTTDSIDFSSDNGSTWTYTPVPDASGFDAAVTNIRLKPTGTMNAAGSGNPSFSLTYRVKVK